MKMTSEIGRILKCLASKSYHSLQDDAYTHVHLIPQAEITDVNAETVEDLPATNVEIITQQQRQEQNKIRRPRSAGDISETLHQCTATATSVTGISTFRGGAVVNASESNTIRSSHSSSNNSRQNNSDSHGGVQNNNNNYSYNHNENAAPSSSSNNGGGILSFFGVKFKSGTRHLERSHQDSSVGVVSNKTGNATGIVANNNNKTVSDLRYTKFPLSKSSTVKNTTVAASGGQSSNSNNNNKLSDTTFSSPSPSSLSAISRHKSKLCRSLDSPQADSGVNGSSSSSSSTSAAFTESSGVISSIPPDLPFEESQIHFTPATKTYTHPHRSPIPPGRPNTSASSSSGNFLTNTVSSIGRRVVNSVTTSSKSKHNKSKLKVKSKSDNNLHRVNSNVNVNSVIAAGQSSTSSSGSIVGVPRNSSASAFTSYLDNHPSHLESGERRLNSVQLGDHATIRLPWTGFQQTNNLSSVSANRTVIPHTHNNNFEFLPSTSAGSGSVERYVECGSNLLRTASSATPNVRPTFGNNNNREINCGPRVNTVISNTGSGSSSSSRTTIATRRRSRSLERCSNFRVLPINNNSGVASNNISDCEGLPSSSQSLFWREVESRIGAISRSQSRKETGTEREKQRTRSAHSLERNTSNRVRQLTPTEQEILLRNIDWKSSSSVQPQQQQQPPRRPDKPSKTSIFTGSSSGSSSVVAGSRSVRKDQHRYPFEKLHRTAPNSSFSNSSESGESSYSAPPSPPPRPPSTLKPDSRLIIHHKQKSTSSALRRTHITSPTSCLHSQGPFSPSNNIAGSGIIMNPVPKRRPVAPRSHGSSSDSGVSHVSSTSTVRGTSDFSDESGGSVNISQHSQHSTSVLSHSTTSSSGVSHHSSSAASNAAVSSATAGISLEDVRNSGFINKPSKGWLHSDQMLSKDGVTYTVRNVSIKYVKRLAFALKTGRERKWVRMKASYMTILKPKLLRDGTDYVEEESIDRRVARILGVRTRLDHAGSDVHLTITSTCLKLTSLDTGQIIAVHDMPNISFASGGDATMLDFVAYVAKDSMIGRACFVLECGSGLAQDVITTVGQAFELRFKEYLQKRPPPPRIPADDPEYYNDLPGKVPPDIKLESKDKIQNVNKAKNVTSTRAKEPPPLNLHSNSDKELSVNLIDFEAPTPPAFGPSVEDKQLDSFLLPGSDNTNGASSLGASGGNPNSVVGTGLGLPNSPSQPQPKDPFDMQPFSTALPQSIPADIVESQRRLLDGEMWFHGTVSRGEAEELMKHDGDFLVRESMACPGQFVLTGLQGDSPRHLLLVDPEGIVRTKDRTFDNVIHLIKYHSENCLPIISAESMVLLRTPVPRVISS